ncbi:hypothetical protein NP590_15515 [Methylomonas sp. SURF-2]|uniref:Uncharacterized protein n=1 Tax=Methylomonas subterranea TaxID=2952225 RepID=A0ABT1TJM1_9GAMM|nr:hypothetical protein [Methylomonas sp. SURF-2]MCQ8105519.1 hypothetical protein [Methylomonas sp. SURF-2]
MDSTNSGYYKPVEDFRACFTDSICDIKNSVRFEIGNKLDGQALESEINRIFEIYLNLAHGAAIAHESTGQELDKCLYDALTESDSSDDDLILSIAFFYALKCGYNYAQGRMDLAMKALIDANFYLGSYYGFCHFATGDKATRSKGGRFRHIKHPPTRKEAAIKYYLDNEDRLKLNKKNAADEISKKVNLSFEYTRNLLKKL